MTKLTNLLILVGVLALIIVGCDKGPDLMDSQGPTDSSGLTLRGFAFPPGATFDSAMFYINVAEPTGQRIDVHRITASWEEGTVTWNNFGGAYAPGIEGSFMADGMDWRMVNVTGLVQDWLDGVYDNFGFLLDQMELGYPRTTYYSKDSGINEPYLEIFYTTEGGVPETENVLPDADAYGFVREDGNV